MSRRVHIGRRGRIFLALFAIALLASVPMRLAAGWFGMERMGLAARTVTGSLWNGRFAETRVGGVAIGDMPARLRFWPLLIGRAHVDFGDDATMARGAVIFRRSSFGFEGLEADLPVADSAAPVPITSLRLTDARIRFVYGVCERAQGTARVGLGGDVAGFSLPPFLVGTMRCGDDRLVLLLVSQGGMEALTLRLDGQGRQDAVLHVRPADAGARDALIAAGFVMSDRGYMLRLGERR